MDIDIMVRQLNELMAFKERAEPMLLSFEIDRMREKAAQLREEDEKGERRGDAAQEEGKDDERGEEGRGRGPSGRGR